MNVEIIKGRKGYDTFKFNNKLLYSLYNPYNEAEQYLLSLEKINENVITFCGADFINSILDKNINIKKIISFSPLKFPDYTQSRKIIRTDNIDNLKKILDETDIKTENTTIIIWPPFIEINQSEFMEYIRTIKNSLIKKTLSDINTDKFLKLESRNIDKNIKKIGEIHYINQKIITGSKDAIVISSGASLEKNIDVIKKIKEKCITFAYPSVLQYLEINKIIPDYIIAVDPGYATFYHLNNYKTNSKLITTLSVTPSIFNLKNYSFIFFNYGSDKENCIYKNIKIIKSLPEGSVAFNLFDILKQKGFNKIFIFAQDFSFYNNRSHVKGGNFEKEYMTNTSFTRTIEMNNLIHESNQLPVFITDNAEKIKSNTPMSIYYNHFLAKANSYPLFLSGNIYNSFNNKIPYINMEYFDSLDSIDKSKDLILTECLRRYQ